jgi:hypothetical protein
MPDEPPAGPGVIIVYFRGPNNIRAQRRFQVADEGMLLHRFVATLPQVATAFTLFTYPRRDIPCQEGRPHGLTRNEVVNIEFDDDNEVDGKSVTAKMIEGSEPKRSRVTKLSLYAGLLQVWANRFP